MKKRSLFERLSSGMRSDDDYEFDDELDAPEPSLPRKLGVTASPAPVREERTEGHLPVDVYQTPTDIVIRTFVAGVRPDEVGVSISRDMVVIEGAREERNDTATPDYVSQELFWGSFSRTIMLPHEVDVDAAQASSKDGLLTIVLPKSDRTRQTKLKVRGN